MAWIPAAAQQEALALSEEQLERLGAARHRFLAAISQARPPAEARFASAGGLRPGSHVRVLQGHSSTAAEATRACTPRLSPAQVLQERRGIFERLAAVEVPAATSLRAMQHATAAWLQVRAGGAGASAPQLPVLLQAAACCRGTEAAAHSAGETWPHAWAALHPSLSPHPPCAPRPARHARLPQVHEATADLTANMNAEFVACMHYVRDAFGYTLTPMQARGGAALGEWGVGVPNRGDESGGGCRGGNWVMRRLRPRVAGPLVPSAHVNLPTQGTPPCHPLLGPPALPLAQKAAAIVRSYPFFPDCYSITTAVLQARRPDLLRGGAGAGQLAAASAGST